MCQTSNPKIISASFFLLLILKLMLKLTLSRMGLFEDVHWWEGRQKGPPSKICHTYPTMIKLDTVILTSRT